MARVRVLAEAPARRAVAKPKRALTLAHRMPRLVLEARRVAANLAHGIHGRRRAGIGESFWQFRPFVAGEAAQRIDWRRSARDDRLYVREREWETAQTVWLWIDRSASMGYVSDLAQAPKIERAIVLGLALAELLRARPASGSACWASWRHGHPGASRRPWPRPWSRTAPRSKTTCRRHAPVAPLRRSRPDQRLPVARARHRRRGRGHLRPRCARPSRHDRRSGGGDLSVPGPGRPARSRRWPVAADRRCRRLGQCLPLDGSSSTRAELGNWPAAAAGRYHPPNRPARRARPRFAS